uniref:Uncharacterized protein n=1 Tax=viral metagenome TaxID=1070528 RepID=A0A6M3J7D7_9ZZZZ
MTTQLQIIENKIEVLSYTDWITSVNLNVGSHATLIGHSLLGNYNVAKGVKDGRVVGIVIYQIVGDVCFIYFVHCVGNVVEFDDEFFRMCMLVGVKRVQTTTTITENTFCRLTQMRKLYSVYEKEL